MTRGPLPGEADRRHAATVLARHRATYLHTAGAHEDGPERDHYGHIAFALEAAGVELAGEDAMRRAIAEETP